LCSGKSPISLAEQNHSVHSSNHFLSPAESPFSPTKSQFSSIFHSEKSPSFQQQQEIIRSVLESAEPKEARGDWATTPVEGLEETAMPRPWEAGAEGFATWGWEKWPEKMVI